MYLQFSNRHCQPSLNKSNSSTGSVTNGGTPNPLGYIMTPCHRSTSSMMAFAIFRGRLCCLLVKCAATSDGYTAHRHFLQTTTCHLDKCSKHHLRALWLLEFCRRVFLLRFHYYCIYCHLERCRCLWFFVTLNAAWRLLILVDFLLMALPAACFHPA